MPQFNRKFANSKPLGVDLPLTAAVGAQIHSQPHDAALVQALLKQVLRPGGLDPFYRGRIDGQVGMQTINAITAYQEAEGAQMSLDRPGFFAPNGNGIKALAAKAPKQIVVMEGTAIPYYVFRCTGTNMRGRMAKLSWAEPVFRDDFTEVACQLLDEIGLGVGFRPLPGVQNPHCETGAELIFTDLTWISPEGRDRHYQGDSLAHYPILRFWVTGLGQGQPFPHGS